MLDLAELDCLLGNLNVSQLELSLESGTLRVVTSNSTTELQCEAKKVWTWDRLTFKDLTFSDVLGRVQYKTIFYRKIATGTGGNIFFFF